MGEVWVGTQLMDVCGRLTLAVGGFDTGLISGDNIDQVGNKRTVVCVETVLGEEPFVAGGCEEGRGDCCLRCTVQAD
jgi:hypothetical protein